MIRRSGFTLAETLIALVLAGIVASAVVRCLVGHQRLYQSQIQRATVNEAARAGVAVLASEIRGLSAAEGDILAMEPSSFTYESTQALYLLCAPPDTGGLAVVLDGGVFYGLRALSAASDSLLIYAENDPHTRSDDGWLSVGVSGASTEANCPGGRPSITVQLDGLSSSELAGVQSGAPIRTIRPTRILTYRDASGSWWLGSREYQRGTGSWSTTQPIVGPLSASGLELSYTDSAGNVTTDVTRVARVGIRIEGQSGRRVHVSSSGGPDYLVGDLVTQVALRNNPWY
jgi:prepilin-type N-terminal cleavage/methylation domain-containing protein